MIRRTFFATVFAIGLMLDSLVLYQLVAQDLKAEIAIKTKNYSDFLLLPNRYKLTYHDWDTASFLSLYSAQNELLDQLQFNLIDKPILESLGNNRYFLQSNEYSYNFKILDSKILIDKKVLIPLGSEGTVERLYFFDGNKSISVFINEIEQYNIYIDSADVRLAKKETYNTGHLKGVGEFAKRQQKTPRAIYSRWSKELFLQMPTDASIVSVSLKSNKISIGFIYMEYAQKYTFRRYFDEVRDKRYVLEENGDQQPELFSVSSFGIADFSREYPLVSKFQIGFTPKRIVDGKLLYNKRESKGDHFNHEYFLVSLEQANSKIFRNKK
jgi:hypothetical protein